MRKIIIIAIACSLGVGTVLAAAIPRSISTDYRVKTVRFDPNNIVVLKGKYGYQTQITFGINEQVQNVSIGDSLAWQAVPLNNYLFLKPVAASKTNMTVLTNQNSYNFQLDSESQNPIPTYKLQFVYTEDALNRTNTASAAFDPAKDNWKYSFTGKRSIAPIEAFDNNQFTYFKFNTDGYSHLPAVFLVNAEGKESLVNYHMQDSYMVIHGVSARYKLRNGDDIANVYNDFALGDWKSV